MKHLFWLLAALLLPTLAASAQHYNIDWYKIAGGGGTSSGGTYTLSGTIGQPDAGSQASGPGYVLTGGFWALNAIQTPGLPNLIIVPSGPSSAKILWPNVVSCGLQQCSNLSTGGWTACGYTVTTANGTNSVTITSPAGNWFFRLKK